MNRFDFWAKVALGAGTLFAVAFMFVQWGTYWTGVSHLQEIQAESEQIEADQITAFEAMKRRTTTVAAE